jgi:tetratricopeptide (TPR) repeat protein
MKKIKFTALIFTGFLLINSCDKSDLELTNPNELFPETFFTTQEQVQSAVNAAYCNLQTFSLYGRLLFYMMDNMSQENSGNAQEEADKRTYREFSFDSSNGQILDYYTSCFLGITKANFVIANADKINAISEYELPQKRKNKFIGEARFLRGYYYFLLVNRVGGVPVWSTLPDGPIGKPRGTRDEVYDLIIKDFKYASENLLDKSEEQNGRATKGAALAFLGKAYLYQKQYALALEAFNKISGYSLESNYYNNFMEETEHGPESIFEVEYDIKIGTGSIWSSATSGQGLNEATFRGQDYGNLNWFNVYPSDDLLNEYEVGDKRLSGSFYFVGDKYNNGNSTMTVDNFKAGGFTRKAAWKKYQNYYKKTDEGQQSGINVKIFRWADVLLMKAECENEVGSQSAAIDYINQVRARAGLKALPYKSLKEEVFDAIVHERKVELAGEQVRFDDIIRWGISDKVLKGTNFVKGKNELWPIPDKVYATNPIIGKQNTGY